MPADTARNIALVRLQLMKAASMLSDEEGLPGRAAQRRKFLSVGRRRFLALRSLRGLPRSKNTLAAIR
jgi:hypothetical protein